MLVASHTELSSASVDCIWEKWKDVTQWPSWDPEVKRSEITGAFEKGARGVIQTHSMQQEMKIEIIECVALHRFVYIRHLALGASLVFTHNVERPNWFPALGCTIVKVTHTVELIGWLAPFYHCLLGASLQKNLRASFKQFIAQATETTVAKFRNATQGPPSEGGLIARADRPSARVLNFDAIS